MDPAWATTEACRNGQRLQSDKVPWEHLTTEQTIGVISWACLSLTRDQLCSYS